MKTLTLIFLVALSISAPAFGQSLSVAIQAPRPQFAPYAIPAPDGQMRHRRTCTATKVGLITLGGSILATGAGLWMAFEGGHIGQQDLSPVGAWMFVGGFSLFYPSLGLAIGGGIHDRNMRRRGLTLVIPRPKQLGLAYNF